MTNPTDLDHPGAQDECASCAHPRHRHRAKEHQRTEGTCGPALGCGCDGDFVELSYGTRMARFVEAAQSVAGAMATVRTALTDAFRALHGLHAAMQQAGLLPEEEPGLCDACDTVTQVTATDDGRAQMCDSCKRAVDNVAEEQAHRAPALQQLATFHHVDCDGTDRTIGGACGGACTQGRNATEFTQDPKAACPWHPEGDCDPGCRRITPRTQDDLQGPVPDAPQAWHAAPHEHGPDCVRHGCPEAAQPTGQTNWTDTPPFAPHPSEIHPAPASTSCATCWPRVCDPNRSECRRRPNAAHTARYTPEGAERDPATRAMLTGLDVATEAYKPPTSHKVGPEQDKPTA